MMGMSTMNGDAIERASDLFKALSEPNRLTIIYLLSLGELSVGALTLKMEMTQSAVSHQLKILKAARLVKSRKEGKSRMYSLTDEHVYQIVNQVLTHVQEKEDEYGTV